MRRISVGAASVVAFLASASVALAQEPTGKGYAGTGGAVQGELGTGGLGAGEVGAQAGSGSLPFTGIDLVFLFAAGVFLLAVGLTFRRLARVKG